MMNEKVKMVIVMRNDLNMRKGKMCAQAGHAAIGAYMKTAEMDYRTNYLKEWFDTGTTKICLYVNSLEELDDLATQAAENGFLVSIIEDYGLTEFHGQLTTTCMAFEPLPSSLIDPITGGLPLL